MSTLAAVAYPDLATAERVRQEVIEATEEHLVRLEDAVIVEHEAGTRSSSTPEQLRSSLDERVAVV
jgi:uncharacterized membrane protein